MQRRRKRSVQSRVSIRCTDTTPPSPPRLPSRKEPTVKTIRGHPPALPGRHVRAQGHLIHYRYHGTYSSGLKSARILLVNDTVQKSAFVYFYIAKLAFH